jgi:MFS family permease
VSRRRLETSFSPRQVLRLSSFFLLVFAFALGFAVGTTISLHIMPYLTDQGLTVAVAVVVVAVSSATGAAASLLLGFLAERLSVRWIMVANLLLLAISFALLQAVHSSFQAFLWGAFYGVAQGAVFTLFQVIFADYYGRESLGAIRGLVSPIQSLAQAVGPVGAALAYDNGGSYSLVFLSFSLLSLASALCVALARPPALPSRIDSAHRLC